METGRVTVVTDTVACIDADCPIRIAVVAPLVVDGDGGRQPGLVR